MLDNLATFVWYWYQTLNFASQVKSLRSNEVLLKKKTKRKQKAQQDLVNNYSYIKEDIEKSVQEKKKNNKFVNIGKERTIISLEVKAELQLEQEKGQNKKTYQETKNIEKPKFSK